MKNLVKMIKEAQDKMNAAKKYSCAILLDPILEEAKKKVWIPCSERQPTESGNYLVTVRSWDETAAIDFEDVDHCNSDGYWLHYHDNANKRTGKRVIAWMPLPDEYRGEQYGSAKSEEN